MKEREPAPTLSASVPTLCFYIIRPSIVAVFLSLHKNRPDSLTNQRLSGINFAKTGPKTFF